MKKAIGVILLLLSVASTLWILYSDWQRQRSIKQDRNEILKKAREQKASNALDKSLADPIPTLENS